MAYSGNRDYHLDARFDSAYPRSMLGVPRRLGAFLMASGISAIGAAIFWIFDIWELWNHAVTAVNIALLFLLFSS